MGKSKEPIRLRRRKMPSGLTSLYLDIYLDGKRKYEYLKLYLVPEKSRADKEKNRTTLQLAEDIRAKRMVELRNGEFGFKSMYKEDTLFYPYYRAMCEARLGQESRGNWGNWYSALHHLKIYDGNENLTFRDITPEWVHGFKDYLENDAKAWGHDFRKRQDYHPLARNSKLSYFNKLRACLNHAFEERIIPYNPIRGVENFKPEEGTRMYLTIEELQKLVQTDMAHPELRRAFLFSCLTGLRRSDIAKLTWGEVHQQGAFVRLIFKQKKTGGQEYLDINEQAAELLGERGKPQDLVFPYMISPDSQNSIIQQWVYKAGINKKISFHCGRHTFAVMMLDLGTDLYTVSKLLGHKLIGTTQIYAKVLDKNKQAAVSRIPSILEAGATEAETTDGEPTTATDKN